MKTVFFILTFLTISFANKAIAKDEKAPKFYVVIQKQNKEENINKKLIRNIFLGFKSRWDNSGARVRAATSSVSTPSIATFLEEVCSMKPQEFLSYWRRKLFSGNGHPPKQFSDAKEVIDYVKSTPNAVGIVEDLKEIKSNEMIYVIPSDDLTQFLLKNRNTITTKNLQVTSEKG